MPIIRKPGAFSDGQKVAGLVCHHCRSGMPLADDLDGLPESFHAECPRCGKSDRYAKAEIQTLVARRKQ